MILLSLVSTLALAGRVAFETHAGPRDQTFHHGWTDAAGKRHAVDFALPADAVARDLAEPLRLPLRELSRAEVAGVDAYARTVKGADVTAKARSGGRVTISVSSRDRSRLAAAMKGAEAARVGARDRYLEAHSWTLDGKGRMRPDHVRVAAGYADDVRPLAEALGMPGAEPRAGLAMALGFVQSIRYERRKRSKDAGFRRPLSLLAADRGDCDGKATLFLALARAAYPELPVAIVYIPDHAFVGVALAPEKGEHTFRGDGLRYVLVEPVGPAMSLIGDGTGRAKRRAMFGAIEVVALP